MLLALLITAGPCEVSQLEATRAFGDDFASCRTANYPNAREFAAMKALKLTLDADPKQVKEGEYTRLVITVDNPTDQPIAVWFSLPVHNEMYPMTVVDAKGRSVVPPPDEPKDTRYHGGACDPDYVPDPSEKLPHVRIVLLPKGRLTEERWWTAEAYAWSKPNDCGRTFFDRSGKLSPGAYRITCKLPLASGAIVEGTTTVTVR